MLILFHDVEEAVALFFSCIMNTVLFSERKNVAKDAVDVGLARHGLNGIVIKSPIGHTIRHRSARIDMFNIAS